MNKHLLIFAGLMLAAGATSDSWSQPNKQGAQEPLAVTQDRQKEVAVTIYNGNLGLVKDIREVQLPRGVSGVKFMDVAAQIDPTTVHLKSLTDPSHLRILEQNY
ncbi:MAG: hypothetical protein HY347_01000, partial [candidate division NC10 bacterium]|nr:hypothetical protein [candidate division NC10 bacterium]